MVNLITATGSMETVWRLYGDSEESATFYGDLMKKLVRRLSGNFIYYVFNLIFPV